ncbi:MAG: M48 family metallopeptidase [Bacilli bacterium]|nr:M48 family metallopeptidase [Bacilli bacterium]
MIVEIVPGIKTEVIILRKRIKNCYIRVVNGETANDKQIVVSVNYRISEKEVLKILNERKEYLKKAILKAPLKNEIRDDEYLLFGHKYNVILTNIKDVNIDGDYIYARTRKKIDEYALKLLENHFIYIQNKYDFPNTNLYIHKMKSRWGVCYPKNKRIGLAKGLIHVPLDLATFVIIHEFCHYKYQNHSVYFYNEMSKYIKEPKKVNKILKNYSYCLYLD